MSRRPPTKVASKSERFQATIVAVPAERPCIGATPRARIQQLARGELRLAVDDLHGLLADHLLGVDEHARQLGEHRETLLRMITEGAAKKGPADLLSALDAISRLDVLQRSSLSELRKTCELLWRMAGPARPKLDVVAADHRRVSVAPRSS